MKKELHDGRLTIYLEGRLYTDNAAQVESELLDAAADAPCAAVTLDMDKLEYISSAGLRVVMKLRKAVEKRLELVNVSPSVYDILEKSSFTSMMNVQEKLPESNDEGSEK